MIEIRLLRAFVTIVESGSFTSASNQLHITQSTISQQLARLEESIGQSLINRNARPLKLTVAGKQFFGYAKRILDLQTEAQNIFLKPVGTIPLRIGIPEDIISINMIKVFGQFMENNTAYHLEVISSLSKDIVDRYRNGEFDIIIARETIVNPDSYASFSEPMAWFESSDTKKPWSEPICLISFPHNGIYRKEMLKLLEDDNKRGYLAFSCNKLDTLISSVEANLGVSILPVSAAKGRNIRQNLQLPKVPPINVSIYTWHKNLVITELTEKIKNILKDHYKDYKQL